MIESEYFGRGGIVRKSQEIEIPRRILPGELMPAIRFYTSPEVLGNMRTLHAHAPDIVALAQRKTNILDTISLAGNNRSRIDILNTSVATLSGNVSTLRTNMNTLGGNVNTLSGNVNTLRTDVNTLRTDLNTLSGNLNTLSGRVTTLETNYNTLTTTTLEPYIRRKTEVFDRIDFLTRNVRGLPTILGSEGYHTIRAIEYLESRKLNTQFGRLEKK
jgi:outer membrane murein-binding lipoprotein Lpp